jgi:DNA-binding protein HU-beta
MGVDRNRRVAGAASLNIASYMPEITANETAPRSAKGARTARKPEKPAPGAHRARIFFRICAKHRLFSMLFSAPSWIRGHFHAHAGHPMPALAKPQQEINMAKKNAAPTKSEILASISKETELSKKQVGAVFDSLSASIKKSLRSHGLFTLPGLLKMKVVKKPATKAREGVNPFNGEKMMFKAKPASKKVRIAALKTLKEFVN